VSVVAGDRVWTSSDVWKLSAAAWAVAVPRPTASKPRMAARRTEYRWVGKFAKDLFIDEVLRHARLRFGLRRIRNQYKEFNRSGKSDDVGQSTVPQRNSTTVWWVAVQFASSMIFSTSFS
jgi:hypothetical protein